MYDVCKKHALAGNAVIPVLFFATLIGSLPFLLVCAGNWLFPTMLPPSTVLHPLSPIAHAQILLKGFIVASSWTFAFFALKHLPISIVAPIRSSAPMWTLLGALILFDEKLRELQWLGVMLTFGGYYSLAITGRKENIHFTRNRWIVFAGLATLLGAVSALYDKFLLVRYPPLTMQTWFYVYLVLLLGGVFLVGWLPKRAQITPFKWRWSIPCVGLLLAMADFVYFQAVASPGSLISLISIVRRTSVVVAFLVGGHVFRELYRKEKMAGLLAILGGVVLIALG